MTISDLDGAHPHYGLHLKIAEVCHEAIRTWCRVNGQKPQRPWSRAGEFTRMRAVTAIQKIFDGKIGSAKALHDEWLMAKIEQGWRLGPKKNLRTKTHPCMVPHEKLQDIDAVKNELTLNIVHSFFGECRRF